MCMATSHRHHRHISSSSSSSITQSSTHPFLPVRWTLPAARAPPTRRPQPSTITTGQHTTSKGGNTLLIRAPPWGGGGSLGNWQRATWVHGVLARRWMKRSRSSLPRGPHDTHPPLKSAWHLVASALAIAVPAPTRPLPSPACVWRAGGCGGWRRRASTTASEARHTPPVAVAGRAWS